MRNGEGTRQCPPFDQTPWTKGVTTSVQRTMLIRYKSPTGTIPLYAKRQSENVYNRPCLSTSRTSSLAWHETRSPRLGSTERRVVWGCFAYDDCNSGQIVLLTVHQGIHITHLGNSLIPPFQVRENDVVFNDRPKFQTINPPLDDDALIVSRDDGQPIRALLSKQVSWTYHTPSERRSRRLIPNWTELNLLTRLVIGDQVHQNTPLLKIVCSMIRR